MEKKYRYDVLELFGVKFVKDIYTDAPVQFNDFLEIDGRLLQVKQISHEFTKDGYESLIKLFVIIVQPS